MSVALTMTDVFDPVRVQGDFPTFVNELNLAAAAGKQYVITREVGGGDIALETKAIKVIRNQENEDAYISGN